MRKLADLTYRRARLIVVLAFVLAGVALAFGANVAGRLKPYDARDPSTPSAEASDRIAAATGVSARPTSGLVALVRAQEPVDSPAGRRKLASVVSELRRDRDVVSVRTAFSGGSRAQISVDGHATYVDVGFRSGSTPEHVFNRIEKRFAVVRGVELTGPSAVAAHVNKTVQYDLRIAELIVFPILAALSLWFFRSVVAALLPLLVAGLAIAFTFVALRVIDEALGLSLYALNLVNALALGLGIDYSLFIVSRYREEAVQHGTGQAALRRTLATAGRTVLFSSLTLTAAMASLLLFPQNFIYSNGIGGMLVSVTAAAIALLVLPAMLTLLGPRVNALAPRRLRRAADDEARGLQEGFWYRLSRFVMRRPARVALVSGAVLIVLGLPFTGIKFTSLDASVLPAHDQARVADSAIHKQFPTAATSPLVVAVAAPPAAANRFAQQLRTLPNVRGVAPTQQAGPRFAVIDVATRAPWLAAESQALVKRIRALRPGFYVGVAGQTADFVDLKSSLTDHLPASLILLCVTTFLIMFALTGSFVLPVKALVMNVLTLSASLGILVLVFQDGRLQGLLSYTTQGALESSFPVVVFAVAFGVSTDYAVFLLSRIKEARDRGVDDREAVARGLQRTGRIVTAAAMLFCVAMGALAISRIIMIKEIGLGLALAVLIDATIARALLVPSLMALLGRWNWWAPAPLRRIQLRLALHEEIEAAPLSGHGAPR